MYIFDQLLPILYFCILINLLFISDNALLSQSVLLMYLHVVNNFPKTIRKKCLKQFKVPQITECLMWVWEMFVLFFHFGFFGCVFNRGFLT